MRKIFFVIYFLHSHIQCSDKGQFVVVDKYDSRTNPVSAYCSLKKIQPVKPRNNSTVILNRKFRVILESILAPSPVKIKHNSLAFIKSTMPYEDTKVKKPYVQMNDSLIVTRRHLRSTLIAAHITV